MTDSPGRLIERLAPEALGRQVVRVDEAADRARPARSPTSAWLGRTGQIDSSPLTGSLMMPLAKDEAAALGLPGRTVTVGRRSERPSMKPLRV